MTRIATDHEAVSFLAYQPDFDKLLGRNPSAHLLLESTEKIPLYHEACIYHPPTRSIFVTSNQLPSDRASPHTSSKQVKLSRVYDNPSSSSGHAEFVHFEGIEGAMLNGGVNFGEDALLLCAQGSQQHDDLSGLITITIPSSSNPVPEARTLLSSFYGVPFNSVNDVVVDPRDRSIWFTDPEYGHHQGIRHPPQLPNQVYRFDPTSKSVRAVADGFTRPNGLCFSPDFDKLYVTDTGAAHGSASTPFDPTGPSHIYCFDIMRSEKDSEPFLSNKRLFAYASGRCPDGIKCDTKGNVYSGCGDGIEVWNSAGVLLGVILVRGGFAPYGRRAFCLGSPDMDQKKAPIRVAVVGSGLAGLVTAYLLQQDVQSRYAGSVLSLDSASVSVPGRNQYLPDRIDVPMRAFAGGYYNNLKAMYEYLGAEYQAQRFLYSFSKKVVTTAQEDYNAGSILPKGKWLSYFVHSSNLHLTKDELFDRAVLAVSPDVVAKIFSPLQHDMAQIPTVSVESIVHTDEGSLGGELGRLVISRQENIPESNTRLLHNDDAQTIYFCTSVVEGHRRTEAVHIQPSGALVTTCPFSQIDRAQVIKSSRFTRVLRTPKSRRITNDIFGDGNQPGDINGEKRRMVKTAGVALLTVAAAAVVVLGLPSGLSKLLELLSNFRATQAGWFFLGVLFYPLVNTIQSLDTQSKTDDERKDTDGSIYGLHHGRLNIALPPPTMWMNMGYWKVALKFVSADVMLMTILKLTSEFPNACRALLEEVLIDAKLLPRQDRSSRFKRPHTLTIIDLGFGCGDQTVYLVNEISKNMSLVDSFTGDTRRRLIDRYVGVTESRAQFKFAENRLTTLGLLEGKSDGPSVQIFCADAAQPASWCDKLVTAAKERPAPPPLPYYFIPPTAETGRESFHRQTWVLALDTLYHFSPSRLPILNHAYSELEASLMAFDLMLADHVSSFDRALLAAVSVFAGIPFANFLTAAQYRKMLVSAGYAEKDIAFRDISGDVFAPLVRFMDQKDQELGGIVGLYAV
ncbi:hypothetical protein DV737_g2701, partial [Chaetothyriales sp. CBS 132003]